MNKIIKDSITGVNGEDFDVGRILWAIGCLSYIVYAGWHLFFNHNFNPLDYGTGLGALLAGGGAGLGFKSKTEPGGN